MSFFIVTLAVFTVVRYGQFPVEKTHILRFPFNTEFENASLAQTAKILHA